MVDFVPAGPLGAITVSVGAPDIIIGDGGPEEGTLSQTAYQFLEDDAGEGANTPLAAENTPVDMTVGVPVRLRLQVDLTGASPGPKRIVLKCKKVGDSVWRKVLVQPG